LSIFHRREAKKTESFTVETNPWWRDFDWENGNRYVMYPTVAKAVVPAVPTESLVALHCSSCGAPFNPTQRHCEYCGTWFGPKPESPKSPNMDGEYAPMGAFVQKDYDKTLEALSDSCKKIQEAIDLAACKELMAASQKFKSLGLLSG